MEVANYMYNNGATMAKRPSKSTLGDFAETEQDYMVRDDMHCELLVLYLTIWYVL
jgi:hypothetical protein